ncbi:MAG: T9SS type A sorting domain-containing protein [Bacteroidales bacterium]|nr:T9SS type A sorting domain-containing protein [Bacteroidales bacterium]
MKTPLIALTAICMFGFGTAIHAQNAIPASGGNASGSGGSVSYSVGQIVYTTNTGTNGSAAQGVQQPYEISVVTSIEEALDISLEMVVYPNPTTDFIKLKIENYEVKNLRYQLYDINGSLLKDNKVEGNETNIVMNNFLPATYFLKVTDNNKVIKTFKIIKN